MAAPSEIFHLTNCRLAAGGRLEAGDLWVDGVTGKIVDGQASFFSSGGGGGGETTAKPTTVDMGGRIVSAGFIECQLNGGYGFDFSVPSTDYAAGFARVNRLLVQTGVTSYLPTLTSQRPEVYRKVLPLLAPAAVAANGDKSRDARLGAEPLGTHCEGPFMSLKKPGIHAPAVLQQRVTPEDLAACYGRENLRPDVIRKITLAPELDPSGGEQAAVASLVARGIVASMGHTAATNEQAAAAIGAGANMVTHMFNAMPQPHHRDVGVFGTIGGAEPTDKRRNSGEKSKGKKSTAEESMQAKPFFGLITDGVHVSPQMCAIAYAAHPRGCIVVTDSLHVLGLPDGVYAWPNGGQIRKQGTRCSSLDGKTLAGASVTLPECVGNLIRWTGIGIAAGLATVTEHPARLLGLEGVKGSLAVGADADLVVLDEAGTDENWRLEVAEVWKFGRRVYAAAGGDEKARL